jgi:glycosyltransferase involved in cell wall biosynthesis
LIIIDDCSTDNTFNKVEKFINEHNYTNIFLFRNDKNKGAFVSLNEALLKARGKYIARIDSDDILINNMLELHLDAFEKNNNCLITQSKYDREGKIMDYGEITLVYDKKIINDIGFYDSVRFAADAEFKDRIIKYYGNNNIIKINKILYKARHRNNSLTTSGTTGTSGRGLVIRANYVDEFRKWHNNNNLYMPYPQTERPFPVPDIMLP